MMQNVKIILIEDELYNLRLLEEMIGKLRPNWEIVKTFAGVKESINWLKSNPHPDLFFMDIQLADGLCFSIFNEVEIDSMVIFTTAYDKFAIRAFEVNSVDYLLKPFREKDLERAILKYEYFSSAYKVDNRLSGLNELVDAIRRGEKRYRKRFLLARGDSYNTLDIDEVAYIYCEKRVTTAIDHTGRHHVIDFSLESLESQLDPDMFYRVNRQLIVKADAIEKIENHFGGKLKLKLTPPHEGEVFVSRLKARPFKMWLQQ